MTSASRTEPPGSMAAVTPAATATARPSKNGKKASEARTLPRARSPPPSPAGPAARRPARGPRPRQAVQEREEGVRGEDAAPRPLTRPLDRQAHAGHAVRLAGAPAPPGVVLSPAHGV